jgi:very-short-patch-repair endonuclease
MLNITKTKCCEVIVDTLAQSGVLADLLRDCGVSERNIEAFFQDMDDTWKAFILREIARGSDDQFNQFIELAVDARVSTGETRMQLVTELQSILVEESYKLVEVRAPDHPRYKLVNQSEGRTEHVEYSGFNQSFPYGLPVALTKPTFSAMLVGGGHSFKFTENNEVGVLQGDVYPNFCMSDFMQWANPNFRLSRYAKPDFSLKTWSHPSWTIAYNLCQTDKEKQFFSDFLDLFVLPYEEHDPNSNKMVLPTSALKDKVPALIPQVWIQWTSQNISQLNRIGYVDTNSPYRLDFVAFWGNRRYAILLDGIQHYAKQVGGRWDADEQVYAARLKEDRLLRVQGWNVFRVGNWEVKDSSRRAQVLEELRGFIDFEHPPYF